MHDVYKPHHPPYVCLLIIIVPYMLHLLYNPNPPPFTSLSLTFSPFGFSILFSMPFQFYDTLLSLMLFWVTTLCFHHRLFFFSTLPPLPSPPPRPLPPINPLLLMGFMRRCLYQIHTLVGSFSM